MQNDILNQERKISILVADDHKLLRETWDLLFGKDPRFQIVGGAANGEEAIRLAEKYSPDIILMDINMEPMNGLDAAAAILRNNPKSKIIAVSVNMYPAIIKKILNLGLWGYVSKYSSLQELTGAILNVHSGHKHISREVKEMLAQTITPDELTVAQKLTYREISVLQLIKQGLSSREIAANLGISSKTVEVHRYNLLKKMKLRNTAALVNYCAENGI